MDICGFLGFSGNHMHTSMPVSTAEEEEREKEEEEEEEEEEEGGEKNINDGVKSTAVA